MMLAIVSALSGGLVILPALFSEVSPITREDMFQIRTGGDRLQQTVPLLRGMRRFQVHRIVKTGEIGHIDAGDSLYDQGDVADRVYVVISGVFGAVMAESPGGHGHDERRTHMPKRVNRLRVGNVVGEMGLLTSG